MTDHKVNVEVTEKEAKEYGDLTCLLVAFEQHLKKDIPSFLKRMIEKRIDSIQKIIGMRAETETHWICLEKAGIAEQRSKHKENCLEGCLRCKSVHKCSDNCYKGCKGEDYVPSSTRSSKITDFMHDVENFCNEAMNTYKQGIDEKVKK